MFICFQFKININILFIFNSKIMFEQILKDDFFFKFFKCVFQIKINIK